MSIRDDGSLKITPYRAVEHRDFVAEIYQSAMSTEPWLELLSRKTVFARIDTDFSQPFSEQYVAKIGDDVCAAMWWDETNMELLRAQRGEGLTRFWQRHSSGAKTVWFRDLLIGRTWQSRGIGGKMVNFALEQWMQGGYKYALLRVHLGGIDEPSILPNVKAIKLYEKKGFVMVPEVTKVAQDINGNNILMGYMIHEI
jgi:GNAT superfamily N-acetyltransferase